MNRINTLFKNKNRNILSIYFCAGYPNVENTSEVIETLEKNGVDMIEIGIPFSDPMADGEVIQKASTEALKNGMSLKKLFFQIKDIRKKVNIPLILMGYLNPIMQFGFENFCIECKKCGIDGCIIPDLPFNEYQEKYKMVAEKYDVKITMLITPETSDDRIKLIDKNTDGFIYMVSSASTTGAQQNFDHEKEKYFNHINNLKLKNPQMVGFGISNKETYDSACLNSSGGIIGSAFVTLLGKLKSPQKAITELLKNIM